MSCRKLQPSLEAGSGRTLRGPGTRGPPYRRVCARACPQETESQEEERGEVEILTERLHHGQFGVTYGTTRTGRAPPGGAAPAGGGNLLGGCVLLLFFFFSFFTNLSNCQSQ